ncbi:hypothetical protein LTR95_016953 [Oleoguttula sp. CCFEE 5521]
MADVYSNAIVVLAAEDAPNFSGGLLTTQEGTVHTHSIAVPVADGDQAIEFIIRVQGPFNAYHSDRYRPRSDLSTRGWALQEFLLAPRILHFRDGLATMSCFEGRRRPDRKWMHSYTTIRRDRQPYIRKDMLGTNEPGEMIMLWYETLFSRFFAQHAETKYLAGLWPHDLVRGLAWVTRGGVDATYTKRATTCHTSWSPLNAPGAIFFPFTFAHEQIHYGQLSPLNSHHIPEFGNWVSWATVLSSSTTYKGGDPHMQINGGQVTLSVPLISGNLIPMQKVVHGSTDWGLQVTGTDVVMTIMLDDPDVEALAAGDMVSAMLLGISNPAADWSGINAMCIKPVREATQTYTRIGFVSDVLGRLLEKMPFEELLDTPRQEVILV